LVQGRQGPAVTVMRRLGYVAQLLGDLSRVPVAVECWLASQSHIIRS